MEYCINIAVPQLSLGDAGLTPVGTHLGYDGKVYLQFLRGRVLITESTPIKHLQNLCVVSGLPENLSFYRVSLSEAHDIERYVNDDSEFSVVGYEAFENLLDTIVRIVKDSTAWGLFMERDCDTMEILRHGTTEDIPHLINQAYRWENGINGFGLLHCS